MKFKLNYQRH